MFKNTAAKFIVFAFDATTNVPKTGDAANITAYVSKDYGTVTVLADTSATEMDATNAPGYYLFDAAQGETNGDVLLVSGKSATANIKMIGAPAVIFTRPTTGWLAPTVANRTVDVSATGEVGVDWANVGSPTTTVDLSGTTIKTTQKVDVDTIKTNPVVNGGTMTFPTNATLASTTNISAGTMTTVTNLTNAPTAGDLTATMKTSAQTAADAAVTANSLVNAIAGYIDTEVAAIKAKTDQLTFTVANQVDANALSLAAALRPGIRKNTALANFEILMTDSTNHNPATGLAVSVQRSIAPGALADGTLSAVTELSNGIYKFDFGANDLNGDIITVRATATGADDLVFTIRTSP